MAAHSRHGKFRITFGLAAAVGLLITATAIGALTRTDNKKLTKQAAAAIQASATIPTTTTTLPPCLPDPAVVALPALPGGSIGPGSSGPVVQAYEQRLADVHFDTGDVDGKWDSQTTYAVQGLEKLEGLPIISRITTAEQAALQTFKWPAAVVPNAEIDRVEVDITRQILILWRANNVALISTVSTGSGANYCYVPKKGNTHVHVCTAAWTPSGRFQLYYFYNGWQDGDLGRLYNPYYFNGGIAIHGYPSVPIHAASHGCTRIPMHTSDFFHTMVFKGMPVYVVGGPNGNPGTSYTPIATTTAPPSPDSSTTTQPLIAPNTTEIPTTTSPTSTTATTTTTP